MRFVKLRIGDRRINRLVRKWLKAEVIEEGELVSADVGTAQGRLPRHFWQISSRPHLAKFPSTAKRPVIAHRLVFSMSKEKHALTDAGINPDKSFTQR